MPFIEKAWTWIARTLGALLTGFLATPEANPNLNTNLADIVGKTLWLEQLKAMALTLVLATAGTAIVATAVKSLIGLRPDADAEEDGLDGLDHGEAGYHLDEDGVLADTPEHAMTTSAIASMAGAESGSER